MPVDNRYTGVGYEPPFETPSDKDFMAAHIESLEQENAALRAEVERMKHEKLIRASDLSPDLLVKALRAEVEKDYLTIEEWKRKNTKLESEVERLKEDLDLRAKSYDANSKGWQADVRRLRIDLAEAVRLLKSCLNGLSYMDRTEARAFLARMEVKE
jgi:FtsZ-binding cell division protein ZapB